MRKGLSAPILAAVLALTALACSETGSQDLNLDRCDYIVLPGIAQTETYTVRTERDCLFDFRVPVDILVDFLAQGPAGPVESPTQLATFRFTHYIVSYRNITQGGSSEWGVDVPYPFEESLPFIVGDGGNFPATLEFRSATVLQESARTQPPLSNDAFFFDGTDPLSGVVLEAEIVFWGHPVGQAQRECRGTMIFQFTIFDDDSAGADAARCAFEATL